MQVSTRYWLFQLPGWIFNALLLVSFHQWFDLPIWVAATVMCLLVAKDIVLYPFLRSSYDTRAKTGVDQLVGQTAIVQNDLHPEGFVLIRGELWRARLEDSATTMSSGSVVRVKSGKGLTLTVSVDDV